MRTRPIESHSISLVLGPDTLERSCHATRSRAARVFSLRGTPLTASLLVRNGNNQVWKLEGAEGPAIIAKRYHTHSGVNEFQALTLLWNQGFEDCVPRPIEWIPEERVALLSLLEGAPVAPSQVTEAEVRQAVAFVERLLVLSSKTPESAASPGRDSRRKLRDTLSAIERRMAAIREGARTCERAAELLELRLLPLQRKLEQRFFDSAKSLGVDPDRPIEQRERILSPSDFGFHNALIDSLGRIRFIDFEYFGWDDPLKLVSDFFHSVSNPVAWPLKWLFLDLLAPALPEPDAFLKRWEVSADLFAFEWILIVLNVLDPDVLERRAFGNPGLNQAQLITERLDRATEMLDAIDRLSAQGRFLTFPDRAIGGMAS